PQNSEADISIIAEAKRPICKRPIHRNEPNRPHIPSYTKFSKSRGQKFQRRFQRFPAALPFFAVLSVSSGSVSSVPSGASLSVSASVRRYLGVSADSRKRKKRASTKIRHTKRRFAINQLKNIVSFSERSEAPPVFQRFVVLPASTTRC
ncbi:hypothetical protein, partial [Pararhodobacter marinus]